MDQSVSPAGESNKESTPACPSPHSPTSSCHSHRLRKCCRHVNGGAAGTRWPMACPMMASVAHWQRSFRRRCSSNDATAAPSTTSHPPSLKFSPSQTGAPKTFTPAPAPTPPPTPCHDCRHRGRCLRLPPRPPLATSDDIFSSRCRYRYRGASTAPGFQLKKKIFISSFTNFSALRRPHRPAPTRRACHPCRPPPTQPPASPRQNQMKILLGACCWRCKIENVRKHKIKASRFEV